MNQSFMDLFIPLVVFGWPFFVISILLSITGILNNRYGLVLLGTVFILPFAYYLMGTTRLAVLAVLIPIFHLCCAWAVKDENDLWSWLWLSPTIIVRLWLLVFTWTYTNLGPF